MYMDTKYHCMYCISINQLILEFKRGFVPNFMEFFYRVHKNWTDIALKLKYISANQK